MSKTIRIPLAGTHNQRSVAGETAIAANQDQRFINVIFDVVVNPITGKATLFCSKRPGLSILNLVSSGNQCTGFIRSQATGTIFSAFGATNSTIFDGVTSLGAISGQALFFNETKINGVGQITFRSSDGTAWYYPVGGSLTQITDGDFVTTGSTVTNFEFLNGFAFYGNVDGFVYQSDINSITSYGAANKIPANIKPDSILAIAHHSEYILAFGNQGVEFFNNAQNAAGSVLGSSQNLYKDVGIQHQRSMAYLGNDIYFASSTIDGDTKMRRMSAGQITTISTAAEDRIMGTAVANGGKIYVSAFQLGGYSYGAAVITSAVAPTDTLLLENGFHLLLETGDKLLLEGGEAIDTAYLVQLVYNIELKIWCEWQSGILTWIKGLGNSSNNQIAAAGILGTSGKIYTINPSAGVDYTDDGTAYSMIIQTSGWDGGTDNRKIVSQIDLISDISSGTCLLESNDNDYNPGSWVTRGQFDMTQQKKQVTRCGSHTGKRAYRLTHSDNAPFRAEAIDITYDVVAKQ